MRCPDTNKFAGFDEPEAEADDTSAEGFEVTVEYRAWRPCAECGAEAAEYGGTATGTIVHACDAAAMAELSEEEREGEPEFDVDDPELSVEQEKRLFTVSGEAAWACQRCAGAGSVTVEEAGIAASAFEDTEH